MAPIFGFRRGADDDDRAAGGKLVRNRRIKAADRKPYARLKPASLPPTEEPALERSGNPNWLSGLIYPARVVASGAGKVISAVFRPDPLSPSSSSSSGGDSSSDDEDAACADDDELNKELFSTDKRNMHLIQQLVMQETFSREECDELIKLIKSRVVNWDSTLSNTDTRINAVMEAKKWLEEKKFLPGSNSQVTENEIGSPADLAKSFMQDRPSWSSASLKKHVEFGTPSPMQSFKEEISKSIFRSPVHLSEMKTSDLSVGSWNISDEIRKVRSKATEELLATTPSKKIDLTSFSVEDKSTRNTTETNMDDMKLVHDMHNLSSLVSNIEPNASVHLVLTNSRGLPEAVGMECERLQTQGSQTNTASLVLKQSQDNENIQAAGHLDAAKGTDPSVGEGHLHSYEMNGLRDSVTDDQTLSLSAADQTLEPHDKEEMEDAVDLTQDKMIGNNIEENRNEHSDRELHANDNDHIVSGSQDSSSLLYEDSLQDSMHFDPKQEGKKAPPGRRLWPRKGKARAQR